MDKIKHNHGCSSKVMDIYEMTSILSQLAGHVSKGNMFNHKSDTIDPIVRAIEIFIECKNLPFVVKREIIPGDSRTVQHIPMNSLIYDRKYLIGMLEYLKRNKPYASYNSINDVMEYNKKHSLKSEEIVKDKSIQPKEEEKK